MRHPVPPEIVAAAKVLEAMIVGFGASHIDTREIPQMLQGLGFYKSANGCATRAFISDSWVLKFDRGLDDRQDMDSQARFINDMRKNPMTARYFPKTYRFGKVLVQETCKPNPQLYDRWESEIRNIAKCLGLSDAHMDNVGWRFVDKGCGEEPEPVFIDCGFNPIKRKERIGGVERSWVMPPFRG